MIRVCLLFMLMVEPARSIRIGGIFRKEPYDEGRSGGADGQMKVAFQFAIAKLNRQSDSLIPNKTFSYNILYYADQPWSEYLNGKQACEQLALGVAAIVTSSSSHYIKSVCHAKKMPYIGVGQSTVPNWLSASGAFEFAPTLISLARATADIVISYRWSRIVILSCYEEGAEASQSLLEMLSFQPHMKIVSLRLPPSEMEMNRAFNVIKQHQIRNIVVICTIRTSLLTVLHQAQRQGVLDQRFNYFLFGLDSHLLLRDHQYTFGGYNMTCLSILDANMIKSTVLKEWQSFIQKPEMGEARKGSGQGINLRSSTHFTTGAALMYDALLLYARSLASVYKEAPLSFYHRSLPCSSYTEDKIWNVGPKLIRSLQAANFSGLTGPVRFTETGYRSKIQLSVLSVGFRGLKKIGEWVDIDVTFSQSQRLLLYPTVEDFNEKKRNASGSLQNATLIVTTIVESPYVFRKTSTINGTTKHVYSGYCIELLHLLAGELGFSYKLVEVPDGIYGDKREDGSWDGMMGEIIAGRADIAVAPLTITYDREKAVRFTKPYMSLGVSILFQRPHPGSPSLFAFLKPLSLAIWIMVIASYLAISLVMSCIAKVSPYEREPANATSESSATELSETAGNFGVLDSLWYGAGALMQQGSEGNPRSVSLRLMAAVWWFFSLIIISSYTANLAACLTVTRMEIAITSAEDLAAQTKIKYGTLREGSTESFFRNSKVKTYAQIWHYLSHTEDAFVHSNEEGIRRVVEAGSQFLSDPLHSGGYAYLMESATLEYVVSQNCNLTQIGGLLDTRGYGIATMDSTLRDKLSVSILKLQENGILDQLKQKWWKANATECPVKSSSDTESLTITNMGGAFVFLLMGALVAILAALMEFTFHKYKTTGRKRERDSGDDSSMNVCEKNLHNKSNRSNGLEQHNTLHSNEGMTSSCHLGFVRQQSQSQSTTQDHLNASSSLADEAITLVSNDPSDRSRFCRGFRQVLEEKLKINFHPTADESTKISLLRLSEGDGENATQRKAELEKITPKNDTASNRAAEAWGEARSLGICYPDGKNSSNALSNNFCRQKSSISLGQAPKYPLPLCELPLTDSNNAVTYNECKQTTM